MIDTSNVVSIVRNENFRNFHLFIDHLDNDRIDVCLYRINIEIGELQYVRGTIQLCGCCSCGDFKINIIRNRSIVSWDKQIVNDINLSKLIIKALKQCINELDN